MLICKTIIIFALQFTNKVIIISQQKQVHKMKETKKIFIHVESDENTNQLLEDSIALMKRATGFRVTKKDYLKKLIESEYERLQTTQEVEPTA